MRIEEFLSKVCDQVRCKKAQPLVLEELKAHIEDQKRAYESEGLETPLAEQRAVQEMGDPVLVGEQLNHAHRPKPEWGVIGLMLLISVLGIIVQTVLPSGEAQAASTAWMSYIPIGLALTMLMYFLDFTVIGRYPAAVYLTVILVGWAVCRVFTPITFGTYRYQYFFTILAIPFYAGIVYRYRNKGFRGIAFCCAFLIVGLIPALAAPVLQAALILGLCGVLLITMAIWRGHFGGDRKKELTFFWTGGAAAVALMLTLYVSGPAAGYRFHRLISIFFGGTDYLGMDYWTHLIRQNLSQASFLSGTESGTLTELSPSLLQSDYILTYLSVEKGLWGSLLVILAFAGLLWYLLAAARKQKNMLGGLVSSSIVFAIALTGLMYIASNLGASHIFGGGFLPLISAGKLEYLTGAVLIGIFLSACKGNSYLRDRHIHGTAGESRLSKWLDRHELKYRLSIKLEKISEEVRNCEN